MTVSGAGARALSPTVRRRLLATLKRRAEAGDLDAAERLIRLSWMAEQGAAPPQRVTPGPAPVAALEAP